MTRFLLFAALCGAVLGAASSGCFAQADYASPWAIKAGGFFPIDEDTRKGTSDIWLMLGGDYTFRRSATYDLVGTVEWFTGSGIDTVSVQGLWKRYMSPIGVRPWYIGAGPGIYWFDGDGISTTKFGIPLMVGMDFNENWFGEAKYHLIFGDLGGDAGGDGFTVGIGFRF